MATSPGPPADEQYDELLAWMCAVAADRASEHRPVPGGHAFRHAHFPAAHDHGFVLLRFPGDPEAARAATEAFLGGAGLAHRLVVAHQRLVPELAPVLHRHGYTTGRDLVMTLAGSPAAPAGEPAVEELDVEERARVATRGWAEEVPDMTADVCRQLGERITTVLDACDATFLAVRDRDGVVVARADLYVRDGIAQVEEVLTAPAARGRGLGTAVVLAAADRARAAGSRRVFLVADADGRAVPLYRRLGFVDAGTRGTFTRLVADPGGG